MVPDAKSPRPSAYHTRVRDYLRSREKPLWDWFGSARARADHASSLRTALLKATYRLGRESHAVLHEATDAARAALGIEVPVTLYQAHDDPRPNASIRSIPGEAHMIHSVHVHRAGPSSLLSITEPTGDKSRRQKRHLLAPNK